MPAPVLNIPVRADVGQFQQDMNKTGSLVSTSLRTITKSVIEMNGGFLASQGAAGAASIAFGRVLGVLGPIALGISVIANTFKLMAYATELAKQRIEEFNGIAEKANASGFSTDFFQRVTKSGGEAAKSVDDITAALKRFNEASAPKLGGSDLQQRIDELRGAGNFKGNTGVAALGSANNSEERFRAVAKLINEALEKGERLAALDIAGKAFGGDTEAALRTNSGYLDQMVRSADALSKTKIISEDDVGRAIQLKDRMEQAEKILAYKWKPVQDDLAKLGMNYHDNMVSITETFAKAVGFATGIYDALKGIPEIFARAGSAPFWKRLADPNIVTPDQLGLSTEPFGTDKLRAAMRNPANIRRAERETTDIQTAVRGDLSKPPPPGGGGASEADAFTRATDAIEKHTARLDADSKAVGLGAAALERYRAEAALKTAAEQAGIPVTQAMIDKIDVLAQKAAVAGEALAKARVNGEISFGRQTALLSPDEVAIARSLVPLYGNDVPKALASSEAAQLRLNDALRSARDDTADFAKSFVSDMRSGKSAVESLGNALTNLSNKLINKAIDVGINAIFNAGTGGSGSILSLLGIGKNAEGTDNWRGGLSWVGEKGPELVHIPRGAQVIPNDVARKGGAATTMHVNINLAGANGDETIRQISYAATVQ